MSLIASLIFATQPEAAIAGTWKDSEREIVIVIRREKDAWWGRVLSSPRAEEVGKTIFTHLLFNGARYLGSMTKPDDDMQLEVDMALTNANTIEAIAKKWVLSKKLSLHRQ